jgi:hypothetical protein
MRSIAIVSGLRTSIHIDTAFYRVAGNIFDRRQFAGRKGGRPEFARRKDRRSDDTMRRLP